MTKVYLVSSCWTCGVKGFKIKRLKAQGVEIIDAKDVWIDEYVPLMKKYAGKNTIDKWLDLVVDDNEKVSEL